MLKPEHFLHAEYILYYDDTGVWETDSATAIDLLESEYIDGIHHVGFFNAGLSSVQELNTERRSIIIDYYHIDSINPNSPQPPQHHLNSYKTTWDGPTDWEMICQHSIRINYPDISLIRRLYEMSNAEIRTALSSFVKHSKYFEVKSMLSADAVWFMAHVLGAHDDMG